MKITLGNKFRSGDDLVVVVAVDAPNSKYPVIAYREKDGEVMTFTPTGNFQYGMLKGATDLRPRLVSVTDTIYLIKPISASAIQYHEPKLWRGDAKDLNTIDWQIVGKVELTVNEGDGLEAL